MRPAAAATAAAAATFMPTPSLHSRVSKAEGANKGPRRIRRPGQTLVVGLTGSIGMGKSATSYFFKDLAVPVSDADAIVHRLYAPGGAAVQPVRELFGPSVVTDDGGISRPNLTPFVVGAENVADLKKLEVVVFPLVGAAQNGCVEEAEKNGEHLAILDIPLLFEIGGDAPCDIVVVVSAPPEKQRERVLARPGMTAAKFEAILAKQVPDATKRLRADRVIEMGTSLEETRAAVAAFVDECRERVVRERQGFTEPQTSGPPSRL